MHISMQKVATISQFISSGQLNHTNCSVQDRLQKFLEILQNHSQKQPHEVFHKKLFSNILRYSQENTCVGVQFLIKLQAISSVALLKHRQKDTPKQIFLAIIGKFTITPYFKNICEWWHQKVFCKDIFQIRTQQRELLTKKMFTCNVKGCSNQSTMNKNVSYHKVLGEERKDLILI